MQQFINRDNRSLDTQEARALHIVVLILSLLGENFDFDRLRTEHREAADQLKSVTEVYNPLRYSAAFSSRSLVH